MSTFTVSGLLAMIAANHCVPPSLAPVMVGIAQHESGLDPVAIHRNANGTLDVGIAQINSSNFGWLGLTLETALDPCRNIAAGARVLFAKYNGTPPDTIKAAYANGVLTSINSLDSGTSAAPIEDPHSKPSDEMPMRDALHGKNGGLIDLLARPAPKKAQLQPDEKENK